MSGGGSVGAIEGGRGGGEAPPADGDGERLKEESDVGEDKGVIGADLGGDVGGNGGGRGGYSGGGHRRQRQAGRSATKWRRRGRARRGANRPLQQGGFPASSELT